MTVILSLAGCVLLFLGIWGVTVTLPTARLAKNFPEDVQEKLRPRLEGLSMSLEILKRRGQPIDEHSMTAWQYYQNERSHPV